MNPVSISSSEKQYIAEGVAQDVRNDGRQRLDYRHFSLKTGVIAHANGSARITMDGSDILVTVIYEVGTPDDNQPNQGKIMCSVDCTASAGQEFDNKGAQYLNSLLSHQLQKLVGSSRAFDLEKLCLIPGQSCWIVYIDALVLDSSGSLLDSISICTRAAFSDTRIPVIDVVPGDNPETLTIEVNDDPYECIPVNYTALPVCVSLTKIGSGFVVDATDEEEMCMTTRLSVAINQEGNVCGMEKTGPGGIAPAALLDMLKCASHVGKRLISVLDNKLHVLESSSLKA